MRIAGDADPSRVGHQASALYVALCLLVPTAMGLLAVAVAFVVEKLARRGNLKQE